MRFCGVPGEEESAARESSEIYKNLKKHRTNMWPRLQIPKTHTEKGFACSSFSLGRSLDELRSPNSLAMVHSWIGSFSGHLAAQFQIRERLYLTLDIISL